MLGQAWQNIIDGEIQNLRNRKRNRNKVVFTAYIEVMTALDLGMFPTFAKEVEEKGMRRVLACRQAILYWTIKWRFTRPSAIVIK